MAESEKITINLSAVDLGRIDLLVDEGFYSNRTDFIRTAIRSQIEKHSAALDHSMERLNLVMGVMFMDRKDLEKARARGERYSFKVIGILTLANDITPELAVETIAKVKVRGIFNATDAVRIALADVIE